MKVCNSGVFQRLRLGAGAVLAVAGLALAGLPSAAQAAEGDPLSYVAEDLYPMLPASGVYYEPGRGGTGLTIDFDKSGYAFAVFYSYNTDGSPAYYLMQGQYVPSTENELYATGVMGHFDAVPYISTNGECVGEGCTFKEPVRTETDIDVSVTWTTAHKATLTIGSQTWNLQTGGFLVPEDELLVGTWSMVVTSQADVWPNPIAASGVVKIAKASGITASMFESVHEARVPPAGSIIYELKCASGAPASDVSGNSTYQSCSNLFGRLYLRIDSYAWPIRVFLFYNPENGRAGLFSAEDVYGSLVVGNAAVSNGFGTAFSTGAWFFNLFIGSDVVRGRALLEYVGEPPELTGDIVMTRLVDGTLRFRRDSNDYVAPTQ